MRKKNSPKVGCDGRGTATSPPPQEPLGATIAPMERMTALRTLVRCRVLLDLHALPPGTLPDEIDAMEDLMMPGYRERLMVAYVAKVRVSAVQLRPRPPALQQLARVETKVIQ
jgi:hypothetical protein